MRKLDPATKGASALIGVRVSLATLDALDALGARAEIQTPAGPVRLPARSLSRAEALRIAAEVGLRSMGLLPSDIASSATPAPVQPPATPSPVAIATPLAKPSSKPAKGSQSKPKAQALREAVLAALKAAERPGSDLLAIDSRRRVAHRAVARASGLTGKSPARFARYSGRVGRYSYESRSSRSRVESAL